MTKPVWAEKPFEGRHMLRDVRGCGEDGQGRASRRHRRRADGSARRERRGAICSSRARPIRWCAGAFSMRSSSRRNRPTHASPKRSRATCSRRIRRSRPSSRRSSRPIPTFAKKPEARLAFFYERSPWYATQKVGVYPVLQARRGHSGNPPDPMTVAPAKAGVHPDLGSSTKMSSTFRRNDRWQIVNIASEMTFDTVSPRSALLASPIVRFSRNPACRRFRPRVIAAALLFAASSAFAHTNERGIDPQNFDESTGCLHRFFPARERRLAEVEPDPGRIQPVEPRR